MDSQYPHFDHARPANDECCFVCRINLAVGGAARTTTTRAAPSRAASTIALVPSRSVHNTVLSTFVHDEASYSSMSRALILAR
eukprot:5509794-Pleurochrysis_carterae.AAC.5